MAYDHITPLLRDPPPEAYGLLSPHQTAISAISATSFLASPPLPHGRRHPPLCRAWWRWPPSFPLLSQAVATLRHQGASGAITALLSAAGQAWRCTTSSFPFPVSLIFHIWRGHPSTTVIAPSPSSPPLSMITPPLRHQESTAVGGLPFPALFSLLPGRAGFPPRPDWCCRALRLHRPWPAPPSSSLVEGGSSRRCLCVGGGTRRSGRPSDLLRRALSQRMGAN